MTIAAAHKKAPEILLKEKKKEKKNVFLSVTVGPYPLLQGSDSSAMDAAAPVPIGAEDLAAPSSWD